MRNRSLGLLALVVGFGCAVACGGNSHTDFGPNEEDGGAAGEPSGGKGGTSGKGGTAGAGGTTGGTGGTSGTAGTSGTGGAAGEPGVSLTVVVGPVPGETPEVTVTGPEGFSETITETTTFSDVAPGTYTASSDLESARVDGSIVDSFVDLAISGSPVGVGESDETIEVTWEKRPGTGMLWLGNFTGDEILGYTESQLEESNASLSPAVVLNMPAEGTSGAHTGAIMFDSDGSLWVGYCRGQDTSPQAIAKFEPTKLGSTGSPDADIVIQTPTGSEFDCVTALAPAPDGGIWVGFLTGGVIKYSAEQLQASGDPEPEVKIQGTALVDLGDLLFDADGNLWTAAYTSNRINKFSPEQLDQSDPSLTPDLSWTWSSARGPVGLALRNGSMPTLWGTFYDTSELSEFELDTPAGTDPAEATTITSTIFDGGPEQLTFDEQGNVWIGLYDANEFVRIDAADLVTGDQTPAVVIGGSRIKTAYGIRFNPPAE